MTVYNATRDQNDVPVLLATNAVDGTPLTIYGDPVTHALYVISAGELANITIGTTTITDGANGKILYNNNGRVGELTNNFLTNISGQDLSTASNTTSQFTTLAAVAGVGYLTSLNGAVLTNQSTPQTIGLTGARLAKLWATDITCTNAIAGSVTGNAGTVTNATLTTALTVNTGAVTIMGNASGSTLALPAGTVSISDYAPLASPTFTGVVTTPSIVTPNNAITATGNAATVPVTKKISTVTNNSAATLTITMTTTSAVDGQTTIVRILDASAVAQTISWVNTENSTITVPTTSNGSTTLPLTVGFQYNNATSKWRCIATA